MVVVHLYQNQKYITIGVRTPLTTNIPDIDDVITVWSTTNCTVAVGVILTAIKLLDVIAVGVLDRTDVDGELD